MDASVISECATSSFSPLCEPLFCTVATGGVHHAGLPAVPRSLRRRDIKNIAAFARAALPRWEGLLVLRYWAHGLKDDLEAAVSEKFWENLESSQDRKKVYNAVCGLLFNAQETLDRPVECLHTAAGAVLQQNA